MTEPGRGEEEPRQIHTNGGAYIEGRVDLAGGGDFVGRDKIETLIQHLEEKNIAGDYVEHQEITQVFLITPEAPEAVVKWLAERQGLDKRSLQNPGGQLPPAHIDRQIEAVAVAQQEAAAQGVSLSPSTAYHLGLLAAYRRDYDTALAYFQQATQAEPEYTDAFEAMAWLQQSWAMADMARQDYDAAMSKLVAARRAARQTDPLEAQALALRGFIAKTLAQLAEIKQDQAGRQTYYEEAARLFEQAAHLDPDDASAQNGLGNVQYALGNLDAAIEAYSRAVELAPTYAAAYHDLALACQDKMQIDPANATEWRRRALAAWQQTYQLAPDDPMFSAESILQIGQHIRRLERQCG